MTISDENTKVDHNIPVSSSIDSVSSDILCKLAVSADDKKATASDQLFQTKCANCGKVGAEVKNTCNKCKKATYCNAACKKKHRHKHKKDCEEHQRLAAKLHDEELFKQPPPKEDCPICFLLLPSLLSASTYQSCCGKSICCGCFYAPLYDNQGNKVDNKKCPFCRTPKPKTNEEALERLKKRMKAGDAQAMLNQGIYHDQGLYGFPQDYTKALELFHRAGELGYAEAYCCVGFAYYNGRGVERDEKKATHYYEIAALGGDATARYNLGINEANAGNTDRALKHLMIAARSGYAGSLKQVRILYINGHATKDDDTKALRLYQEYLTEIKSVRRDKVAAAYDRYCYYYDY